MSINSLYNPNVATIAPTADIVTAAREMREAHVGDLIAVEYRDGHSVPVGIMTDRDIVIAIVAKQASPTDLRVADLMSTQLLTLREDSGVELALKEMRRAGVRRAPVVGAEGQLRGILSIDDVVEHLAAQLGHIAELIRNEQQHEARTRR